MASELEFSGPNLMIPAACAAGTYAVAHAYDTLRAGRADVMLAGGSDAFSRITYTGFARLLAIAPEICQPFDKNRKGMIPGEGAGMVVRHNFETGHSVFELAKGDHHDHMVCMDSGEVIEFVDPIIEKRQHELVAERGYELVDHSLVLYVKKKS